MSIDQIIIGVFALINIFSFMVTAADKRKSMQGGATERTPEGLLFFMAVAFGSVWVYVAMQLFRHKTRKWYFQVGIPLILLQNIATVYVVSKYVFIH